MFSPENRLSQNVTDYYKFATITVRVFVPKDEVENVEDFDSIAKQKIEDMFKSDTPCKLYEVTLS